MRIVGAVIAGGKASRLGGEKAFLAFAGSTLVDTVIRRFAPQVDELVLNLRADMPAAPTTLPIIRDDDHEIGPLAGIVACLSWAARRSAIFLATVPCDTPFLPLDLVAQLARAAKPNELVATPLCTGFEVASLSKAEAVMAPSAIGARYLPGPDEDLAVPS